MLTITSLNNNTLPLLDTSQPERIRDLDGTDTLTLSVRETELNNIAFSHVENEAILTLDNDKYVIKDIKPNVVVDRVAYDIEAVHKFFNDTGTLWIYDVIKGRKVLTLNQALSHCLPQGYTFTIHDDFSNTSFENFGDDWSLSLFEKIRVAYNFEYVKDGTHLEIYKQIGNKTNKQMRYKHNIVTIEGGLNSTNLATYIEGTGKPVEDDEGNPIEGEYVVKETYTSPLADTYGIMHAEPVSDQRFTDKTALLDYMKSKLNDTIDISYTITYDEFIKATENESDASLGDSIHLIHEVLKENFNTRIVAVTDYPLSDTLKPIYTISSKKESIIDRQVQANTDKKDLENQVDNLDDKQATLHEEIKITDEALEEIQFWQDEINRKHIEIEEFRTEMELKQESILSELTDKIDLEQYTQEYNTILGKLNDKVDSLNFDELKGQFEEIEKEITDLEDEISSRITKTEFDDAVGVDKWILSNFIISGTNLSQTSPSFSLIKELHADGIDEVSDSSIITIPENNSQITHLFTNVKLLNARTMTFTIKFSNSIGIHMNGAMIYENKSVGQTTAEVSMSLRAGWNTIDILHGNHTSMPILEIGPRVSSQVDKMTTTIGVGDKNEIRLAQTETVIRQTNEAIQLKADSTEVTAIGNQVNAQSAQIDIMADEIASKVSDTEFNAYSQRLTNAESSIVQHADQIESKVNQTDYDLLNGVVSEQQTVISQHTDAIKLKAEQNDLNELEGTVSSQGTQIDLNKTAISLSATKTELSSVSGDVRDVRSELDIQAGKIEQTVSKTEFDSLEIGGRNLLTHNYDSWERGIYSSTTGDKTTGNNRLRIKEAIPIEGNQDFHIKSFTGAYQVIYVFYDSNMNYIAGRTWFVPPLVVRSPSNARFLTISMRDVPERALNSIDFKVMVEKGNRATDWTPAPEDVESKIASQETRIKQTENNINLRATKTELTGAINGLEIGGVNLLIEKDIVRGRYLLNTGSFTSSGDWFHTDYIPVNGMKNLTASGFSNLGTAPSVCYYNSSKTFVKGINNNSQNRGALMTIDSGIHYIRFSGMVRDLETLKIEKGTKATTWSHAPEDVNTRLSTAEASITVQAGQIAQTVSKTEFTTGVNSAIKANNQFPDTRSVNSLPSWYFTNYPRQTISEFKQRSAIGVSGSATYGTLTTTVPWSGTSGGVVAQRFESSDGTFERKGNSGATAWLAWSQLESTSGAQSKANSAVAPLITRLNTAETAITSNATAINLRALASNVYTKTEADGKVNTAINTAKSAILVDAEQISQTVTRTAIDTLERKVGNLVKNPAITNNATGWTGGSVTHVADTFEGVSTRVLRNTATTDATTYSEWFDVDPSKAYEATIWVRKNASRGRYYFGVHGSDNGSSNNVVFGRVSRAGVVQSDSNNSYFYTNSGASTSWVKMTGYIMPSGTTPSEMKGLGTANVRFNMIMKPNLKQIRLRLLNYTNGGTTTYMYVAMPKVVEISSDSVTRMTKAEASITTNASAITSKVSTTDYTGAKVTSLINQSASSITLNASKINFNGAVFGTNATFSGTVQGGSLISYNTSTNDVVTVENGSIEALESGNRTFRLDARGLVVYSRKTRAEMTALRPTAKSSTNGTNMMSRGDYFGIGKVVRTDPSDGLDIADPQLEFLWDGTSDRTYLHGGFQSKNDARLMLYSSGTSGSSGTSVPRIFIDNYTSGSTDWRGVTVYVGNSRKPANSSNYRGGFEIYQYRGNGTSTSDQLLRIGTNTSNKKFMDAFVDEFYVGGDGRFAGGIRVGGGSGQYVFTNVVQNDVTGTHLYLRSFAGAEVRFTANNSTTSYLDARAENYYTRGNAGEFHGIRFKNTSGNAILQSMTEYTYLQGIEARVTAVNSGTTYRPIRASSFPTGSSILYKSHGEDFDLNEAYYLLDNAVIKKYHLRDNLEQRIYDKPKIGVYSETVPALIRDEDGVDTYSMVSTLWRVIQHQREQITELQRDREDIYNMISVL